MRELSRRTLGAGLASAAMMLRPRAAGAAESSGSVINVATIGEPPTLDAMVSTTDIVSIITQHIFETLYTYTGGWEVAPLLASAMPRISDDGRTALIPLRQGVRFHNGKAMAPADVVASLTRWTAVSPRGQLARPNITAIEASGDAEVKISLTGPFAPLIPLLAMNNAAAAIMPAELLDGTAPLKAFVGTGPYKLLEHRPDQYLRLVRFADYQSPPGRPDGYAGTRKAVVDEVRFSPVPNAVTRVDGMLSGQYQFADSLPTELLGRLGSAPRVKPIIASPTWPFILIMNTKSAVAGKPGVRQAARAAINPADLMLAGFGSDTFFDLDGSVYSKGTAFHDAETPGYDKPDPAKASALLKAAGYDGQPFRILTTTQYDFMFKIAQVAKEQMEDAGFKIDLQVMDWAALVQRRSDPAAWEMFTSYHTFVPEPSLLTFVNPDYPGWWDTPEKRAALAAFNAEIDAVKRVQLWKRMQSILYEQAPTLVIGQFHSLAARSTRLTDFQEMPWSAFWNVGIAG
jgi:peptide/nickel transport system substrate-binding protein